MFPWLIAFGPPNQAASLTTLDFSSTPDSHLIVVRSDVHGGLLGFNGENPEAVAACPVLTSEIAEIANS